MESSIADILAHFYEITPKQVHRINSDDEEDESKLTRYDRPSIKETWHSVEANKLLKGKERKKSLIGPTKKYYCYYNYQRYIEFH